MNETVAQRCFRLYVKNNPKTERVRRWSIRKRSWCCGASLSVKRDGKRDAPIVRCAKCLGVLSLAGQKWKGISLNDAPRDLVCSVVDKNGGHCPDRVAHTVEHNGKKLGLCERCYDNWLAGAYGNAGVQARAGSPSLGTTVGGTIEKGVTKQ